MIKLEKHIFNPFQENTYIIWDEETLEGIIVDPGCSNQHEEEALTNSIAEKKIIVKYIINTHCHIDHVLGNKFVKEKYGCEFYVPEIDIPLLDNLIKQAEMFGVKAEKSPLPDHYLTEDLKLNIGKSEMRFLFTPGHTAGEYCIIFDADKVCISGDVLFLEGIGRTDLWGGDYNTLLQSIKNKLFTLNDDITVYPGHGDKTTIGHEKINNPFLK